MAKRYRVIKGVNYTPRGSTVEKRAEPPEVVDDLPPSSLGWLTAQGVVEEVNGGVRPQ